MRVISSVNHIHLIKTKKAAKQAGLRTVDQWFKKYRVPFPDEHATAIKGDDYYWEHQTEELFSRSKGQREIGPLRPGAQIVGVKRLPRRSVRFPVYRESDFQFKDKIHRKLPRPRTVELLDAIWAANCTATKFENAAKKTRQNGARADRRRANGFRKRARNLMELVELGIRMAINQELVKYVGIRGKTHRYFGEGYFFRSNVSPPKWLARSQPVEPAKLKAAEQRRSQVRLMDAVFTLRQLEDEATLGLPLAVKGRDPSSWNLQHES